jgi:hypothetical protein
VKEIKMIKVVLCACLLFFCQTSVASATELTDTLTRGFKKIEHPQEEVVVKIAINTQLTHLSGNNKNQEVVQAYDIHKKLLYTLKQNGWADKPLALADVDVGKVEVELGEGMSMKMKKTFRMKAFIHQCDMPMRKYRGGDVDEFFKKIVVDAEECFTHDEKLQGRNYPY